MDDYTSLYSSIRNEVLLSLRIEWQRFGWEDEEIEEKLGELNKVWVEELEKSITPTNENSNDLVGGRKKRKLIKQNNQNNNPNPSELNGPKLQTPLQYPNIHNKINQIDNNTNNYQTLPAHFSLSLTQSSSSSSSPASSSSSTSSSSSASLSPSLSIEPSLPSLPSLSFKKGAVIPQSNTQLLSEEKDFAFNNHRSLIRSSDNSIIQTKTEQSSAYNNSLSASSSSTSSSSFIAATSTPSTSLSLSSSPTTTNSSLVSTSSLPILNPLLLEPLNAGDDDSDYEFDVGEVDNLILCQYDRVTHSKNRWKVVLRDGVMNIRGRDYVFSRANGEFQW